MREQTQRLWCRDTPQVWAIAWLGTVESCGAGQRSAVGQLEEHHRATCDDDEENGEEEEQGDAAPPATRPMAMMKLRFREEGIKRLEAVAFGKLSAESHLLQEKEELLKEIEVLRNQLLEALDWKLMHEKGLGIQVSSSDCRLNNNLIFSPPL
ncbi:hypothetical protein Taro_014336 [Colocasia esculenta]|uniref:Uncharacterized protein n=1 Tax=Colocasia esculenta TaxID=4460 RepID=A0A843UEA6_COLES|nr:hypothetical protein [Colocasia esculenta]